MKTFSILLLTIMIAIFAEKYMAKYLLVEIDQPEGEVNPNEDYGSGSISARGSTIFKSLNLLIFLLKKVDRSNQTTSHFLFYSNLLCKDSKICNSNHGVLSWVQGSRQI